jgi:hypothetical protein
MATKPRPFAVELNLQQYQVLEEVRRQGVMGTTDGEVLRRAFLTWVRKKEKGKSRAGGTRRSK